MAKKVLIISTSLRGGSNSDILARECERGAKEAGHEVEQIATAAEDEESTFEKAYSGLCGWVDCFEKAELKGIVTGGGIADPNDASNHKGTMQKAYELGKGL